MKILPRCLLVFFLLFTVADLALAQVQVRAYTRRDGTHVRAHTRAAPGRASTSTTSPAASTSAPGHRRQSSARISVDPSANYTPATDPALQGDFEPEAVVQRAPSPTASVPAKPRRSTRKVARIRREGAQYRWPQDEIRQPTSRARYSTPSVARDTRGRIQRSQWAKRIFMRMTGYPNGRPGYIVDHIVPLKRGGDDLPDNMQWQTVEQAKAKDRWE